MRHPTIDRSARAAALLVAVVLGTLLTGAGAHAGSSASGEILAAAASPTPARLAYVASRERANGLVGFVVDLGGRVPDGTTYELRRRDGLAADFTVFFYGDLSSRGGLGAPCQVSGDRRSDGNGGETGSIVCGDSDQDGLRETSDRAAYAVVVMVAGIRGEFSLSWG